MMIQPDRVVVFLDRLLPRYVLALLVLLFVVLLAGCASAPATPAADVVLSNSFKAKYAAEGGCALFSRQRLERDLDRAFNAGIEAGEKRRSAL
jgi:hypothetical protein